MSTEPKAIQLSYTNYRGETYTRTITPLKVRWGTSEWHKEPGWLLYCIDHDKQDFREYALKDCDFTVATEPLSIP